MIRWLSSRSASLYLSTLSSRSLAQKGAIAHSVSGNLPAAACRSREYPDSPRVGIGVVVLRRLGQQTEVLLIRRGREPQKGILSFPGGSLELGETMANCAVREILEETGVHLRNRPSETGTVLRSLEYPRPVDAVDAMDYDADGRVKYHYTIVDLAAIPENPRAEAVAADDAEEVIWKDIKDLHKLTDLAAHCARIAEEAVLRFDVPEG